MPEALEGEVAGGTALVGEEVGEVDVICQSPNRFFFGPPGFSGQQLI